MRQGFTITLLVTVLFAGGYLYYLAASVCQAPLSYRLGELDERFDIDVDTAKLAIANAESVWEGATGKNLFTYDDTADFTINFVFDERQALTDAEEDFKDRLDQTKGTNEVISEQYNALLAEYRSLKDSYNNAVTAYEQDLADYNAEVEKYNRAGGAPPDVYAKLEEEKEDLDRERKRLNKLSSQLNTLVTQINKIGSEGNRVIETYNRGVDVYNRTFGAPREFTQGDYEGDEINIYTFHDMIELETVLAHELGHALRLGHVENESSVMFYLIGDQSEPLSLTTQDLDEYMAICGTDAFSLLTRLKILLGIY